MSVSLATANLRAAFKQQLARLSARPLEGGPSLAIRDGALLAWIGNGPETVVDEDLIEVLRRLPNGAGPEVVAGVLAVPDALAQRQAEMSHNRRTR